MKLYFSKSLAIAALLTATICGSNAIPSYAATVTEVLTDGLGHTFTVKRVISASGLVTSESLPVYGLDGNFVADGKGGFLKDAVTYTYNAKKQLVRKIASGVYFDANTPPAFNGKFAVINHYFDPKNQNLLKKIDRYYTDAKKTKLVAEVITQWKYRQNGEISELTQSYVDKINGIDVDVTVTYYPGGVAMTETTTNNLTKIKTINSYLPEGNISKRVETNAKGDATTTSYQYDSAGRVLAERTIYANKKGQEILPPVATTYTYDASGKIVQKETASQFKKVVIDYTQNAVRTTTSFTDAAGKVLTMVILKETDTYSSESTLKHIAYMLRDTDVVYTDKLDPSKSYETHTEYDPQTGRFLSITTTYKTADGKIASQAVGTLYDSTKTENTYGLDGKLTQKKVIYSTRTTPNSEFSVASKVITDYSPSGSPLRETRYNAKGECLVDIQYQNAATITSEMTFFDDGTISSHTVSTRYKAVQPDGVGELIVKKQYQHRPGYYVGTLDVTTTIKKDASGRLLSEIVETNQSTKQTIVTYHSAGRTETVTFTNRIYPVLSGSSVKKYDNAGNLISSTSTGSSSAASQGVIDDALNKNAVNQSASQADPLFTREEPLKPAEANQTA